MYLDTLTRIKNALQRNHERIKVPYSKLDMAVLQTLVSCGLIDSAVRKGRGVKRIIDIRLKYDVHEKPAIQEIRFISKPSRRVYAGYRDLKKSRQGYGSYVISTPRGIMTGYEAWKQKVGGELLFEIW